MAINRLYSHETHEQIMKQSPCLMGKFTINHHVPKLMGISHYIPIKILLNPIKPPLLHHETNHALTW